MNLKQLEAFVKVAETKSFSEAAKFPSYERTDLE